MCLWPRMWTQTCLCVRPLRVLGDPLAVIPTGHRWEKNLALCRELDVSLALTGKPSKTSPAVTALAVSR